MSLCRQPPDLPTAPPARDGAIRVAARLGPARGTLWPAWSVACLLLVAAGCDEKVVQRPCEVDRDSAQFESVETLCDGLDNDCDGQTDVLLPVAANACGQGQGACSAGFSACIGGAKTCLTAPPVAETYDGVDNDCDGAVDEDVAASVALPGMARVAVPPYLYGPDEDPKAGLLAQTMLDHAGVPYVAASESSALAKLDWGKALKDLDQYRLLIIPGYVIPSFIDDTQLADLEAWVKKGGVLVWNKPLSPNPKDSAESQAAYAKVVALGGIVTHTQHLNSNIVRLTGKGDATLWLDQGPEREVVLTPTPDDPARQIEVFTFTTTPDVEVLATAHRDGKALGATWLRRGIGQGAVYTLGFDPGQYTSQRCYVNCFDPGVDVAAMLYKGAWREASQGHYVVKHTVPGTEPSLLLTTHDIDAPDSHHSGEWGLAGAVRVAEMERAEGVKGTFFITSDYVTQYYNAAMVERLCQLEMCPQGGHSVQHFYWGDFPRGDCAVTKANYTPAKPTVCGEVRVNLEMLRADLPADARLEAWRTPYLETSPHQYGVLAEQGIKFDSSLATGDLRSNFPIDLPRYPHYSLEDLSKVDEMWVFPVNLEDGIGWYEDGKEQRRELKAIYLDEFKNRWNEQLLGNRGNGAWSVQLVHPSFGIGAGVDNIDVKIDAVRWTIRRAKALGLLIAPIYEVADFWRGRHHTRLSELTYADGVYKGRITVGKLPARRFSLEFGDNIASFTDNTSSTKSIDGRRVAFDLILPAGAVIAFEAKVATGGK